MTQRLVIFGTIASIPYALLEKMEWWPLNILFTFLLVVVIVYLLEKCSIIAIGAAVVAFAVGGMAVDFLWFGPAVCLAAYWSCRRPGIFSGVAFALALCALNVVNDNFWAVAALPVIFVAMHVRLNVPRTKHLFYIFYPAHLMVLFVVDALLK